MAIFYFILDSSSLIRNSTLASKLEMRSIRTEYAFAIPPNNTIIVNQSAGDCQFEPDGAILDSYTFPNMELSMSASLIGFSGRCV